jgi:hypothetical protein
MSSYHFLTISTQINTTTSILYASPKRRNGTSKTTGHTLFGDKCGWKCSVDVEDHWRMAKIKGGCTMALTDVKISLLYVFP